ncbi:LacI family transcriptional regulator [Kribbella antibiotica]|uniref:LacI family transcriptional regulator n=1 Tax=Kribbella antibiotica TaxID=190195 RepID=A0A4R4ZU66_9ACTN|nr:LacI family DNA-binding transcriptional regulator [Kribbella antibiotica]TDD62688.1 LacI family transcriptional regulator [Kribbella antibiotica]
MLPRVTLLDLAAHIGMSRSTVSMALSDHPEIAAATKERVRSAARELGYVTNSAARALRSQSAGAIALIIPDTGPLTLGHPYFMHLLVGVTEVCSSYNANVILSTNQAENSVAAYERVLRSRAADGAIVTVAMVDDPNIRSLVDSGLPVVLMGNYPQLPDAVSVGIDDRAGAQQVTEHLIVEHNRQRLVHLGGPLGHQVTVERRSGFEQALIAAGITPPGDVWSGDFSEQSGRDLTRQLLATGQPFDAIVAANDEMAYGAIDELRGSDIAVVGFDDFGLARTTTPAITTVRIPADDLARAATERLFQLIGGIRPAQRQLTLPLEVVVRASCGC